MKFKKIFFIFFFFFLFFNLSILCYYAEHSTDIVKLEPVLRSAVNPFSRFATVRSFGISLLLKNDLKRSSIELQRELFFLNNKKDEKKERELLFFTSLSVAIETYLQIMEVAGFTPAASNNLNLKKLNIRQVGKHILPKPKARRS